MAVRAARSTTRRKIQLRAKASAGADSLFAVKAAPSGRCINAAAVGLLVGLSASFADLLLRKMNSRDVSARPSDGAVSPTEQVAASNVGQFSSHQWVDVLRRTIKDFTDDQIIAVAAGVTFFGLLALFPALSAFVSLYGLFADLTGVQKLIATLNGLLPGGAVSVLGDQIARLAKVKHGTLGLTFFVSLILSVWSSNAGVKALIRGLNAAYEERERRKFVALNAISLAFTLGATIFAIVAISAVVAAPAFLQRAGLGGLASLSLLRWPLLLVVVAGLLSLLYRFGPNRAQAKWRWITPGGLAAAAGWLMMSLLFSWYVANFGNYDKTYGSLGAIVGFMTWIWLSIIVVLFGAELNAELEKHTTMDTTTGAPKPAGQRGAAVADD